MRVSKKKKRRPAPRKVSKYIKFRAGLVFLVVLGLMCFLLVRIIIINRNDGENYNKTILSQMSYNSQTIYAERGQILDRNGTVLAYNENRYDVIIEPKNILLTDANVEPTINALAECFGLDRDELEATINNNPNSYYIRVKKSISESERQAFLDYKEAYETEEENTTLEADTEENKASEDAAADGDSDTDADETAETSETSETSDGESSGNFLVKALHSVKSLFSGDDSEDSTTASRGKITGVTFETNQKRIYPYSTLASTTIGFANSVGGVTGLEAQYDDVLKGVNGRKYGYLNQESSVEVQVINETDGYNLRTTIDSYIQRICEDIINQYEEETGSSTTSIMVMNPNNGEIYAMASSRQYDLNDPTTSDEELLSEDEEEELRQEYLEENPEADQDELDEMIQEVRSERQMLLWNNFSVSNSYEPGSTAKVFTIAAALEEDKLDVNDTFVCDGSQTYGRTTIHCHKRSGHGLLTVTGALMASCNDALMQIGARLGIEDFTAYQTRFNFGQLTGIDLPRELSCSNQIYRADNMTAVDLACNSFGQNFYVTMVQMCAAYSSLVNGGNYYIPHVVKQIVDNDGNVIQNIEPTLVRQTVSKSTSEYMKEALLQVVENGTGSRVQIEGYEIGGKTGTAEKADVGAAVETYTVSFMSVVPAYDPEVIVYVVVDEPHVEKSQNTYQAKDLCKAALEQILPYLNIYPTADDDVSDANGDFTSPEDEDSYDDSTPVIENPEDSEAAQQIREAAQNAQSWTGQSSDGE